MKNYTFSSPQAVGQVVNIKYYPASGPTVDLGIQTLPYTWVTNDAFGVFEVYFVTTQQKCYIQNQQV